MLLATFLVDRLRCLGWYGVPLATKEAVSLDGLLLLDWLMLNRGGLVLATKETVPLAGLLLDWLVLNRGRLLGFVTREEGHVDGGWGIGSDG